MTTAKDKTDTVCILCSQDLKVVTSAKCLGVNISNGLLWNTHIDYIAVATGRALGIVRQSIKVKRPKGTRDCL